MARTWWNTPVTVETERIGSYVTINSNERAAEFLLEEWPRSETGPAYEAAKRALLDAHEGRISTDEARIAFLLALSEAGIFSFAK